MTTLLMIRHGQSVANLEGRFAGSSDFPLTELGRRQAACTAEFVAENYRVDAVYSSDLQRAYETGLATAEKFGLPVATDPALREIFAGAWERQRFDDLYRAHFEDFTLWRQNIGLSRCTDGESVAELAVRIREVVDRISRAHDGKTVVIATHATPIRTLRWLATGTPPENMQNIPWPSNASVSEFSWNNGVLTAVHMSMDEHLADLQSALPPNT